MMNRLHTSILTAGFLGFALSTSAVSQQTQRDFPAERTSTTSCEAVNWNANMLRNHPRLIEACQEVVLVDGETWARFDARFKQVERDGRVVFNVLDRRDRTVEEVTFMPTSGQVAYINDRPTPFRQLRTMDAISLYVPEGEYGFATQPGVPREQVATLTPVTTPAPVVVERAAAQPATRTAAVLPATASTLPWFALAGLMALLGGMLLTSRRWF
jgi:LPXTG-motif cell wall-anchored protein